MPLHATYNFPVNDVTFSPNGNILASRSDNSPEWIKLWDIASGEEIYSCGWRDIELQIGKHSEGNLSPVLQSGSLFFSLDGNHLVCGGFIWDLELGKVVNVRSLNSLFDSTHRIVAVSPDLQTAIAVDAKSESIKLCDISTGEVCTLQGGRHQVVSQMEAYCNKFSPDGKFFASLMWFRPDQEKIKVWEVCTGRELCNISLLPEISAGNKYGGAFTFSPDGCVLASNCGDTWREGFLGIVLPVNGMTIAGAREKVKFGSMRETILLSDVATGRELCKFKGGYSADYSGNPSISIVSLAFSPDGKFLVSGDSSGKTTLWKFRKGWLQKIVAQKYRTFEKGYSVVFSPDGRFFASKVGDDSNGITIWDMKTGNKIQTFLGHSR